MLEVEKKVKSRKQFMLSGIQQIREVRISNSGCGFNILFTLSSFPKTDTSDSEEVWSAPHGYWAVLQEMFRHTVDS